MNAHEQEHALLAMVDHSREDALGQQSKAFALNYVNNFNICIRLFLNSYNFKSIGQPRPDHAPGER